MYCEKTWTYPTEESAFKSKFYGKYAWKPQSEKHIIVSGLEYSMSKNGDINFNILYKPIQINGKTYSRAKTGTNKLKYFIDNKNIALSRENLLSNIWGYDFYGDDRTIDTHVKTLRKHLGKYKDMIITVRGMGYKFQDENEKEN